MTKTILQKIDPYKAYTVKEVADRHLIPGLSSTNIIYNLIRELVPNSTGSKRKSVHVTETTKNTLRPVAQPVYGEKQVRRHYIWGNEIIKFLIHNLAVNANEALAITTTCQPQIDEMEQLAEYDKYEGSYWR